MNTMKKVWAVMLAVALLLTLAACGNNNGDDSVKDSTTTTTTTTTTTATDDGLLPDDRRDGSKDLPFEVYELEFDAAVKAGGVTYYDVYRVGGTILTIESKDATVEYAGKTYAPENGVISVPVTTDDVRNPVKLAIGNTGATDATFKVTFAYPKGTLSNPYELGSVESNGKSLTVSVAEGNETGVVYSYTASADGTLMLTVYTDTVELPFDVEMYNLTSGANRTMGEDGEKGNLDITVTKGDEVRITFSVLPNDKNEYPAMTIKGSVCFEEKANDNIFDQPDRTVDYTVTIKDKDGKVMEGIQLTAFVGQITKAVTTDKNGVAKFVLPEGDVTVRITVPTGYVAEKNSYTMFAGTTSLTITLILEDVTPDDPTYSDTMTYTVTLLDGSGNPLGGLPVTFYNGDKGVAKSVGNKQGVSQVTLEGGTYTVKVGGTALKYDEKAATVSVNKPDLTLVLAADIDTSASLPINDPLKDADVEMYYAPEGAVYVTLTAGERNYFLFEPTRSGTFRFDVSNPYAKLGHYGSDMFVYTENSAAMTGNTFTISVSEGQIGNIFVIGIDAATNCTAAVLRIIRIGAPAWDINEEPWVDYTGDTPKSFTFNGGKLVNFDITAATDYTVVYNPNDGYYHKDSATGPVVYVRLGGKAPYVSIQSLLAEYGNMGVVLYNPDGSFLRKEQYAILMQQYVDKMDPYQGIYPLTKDLEYMLSTYGDKQNWWNVGNPGYLFEEVAGVNPNNAWTFLFCYVEL